MTQAGAGAKKKRSRALHEGIKNGGNQKRETARIEKTRAARLIQIRECAA